MARNIRQTSGDSPARCEGPSSPPAWALAVAVAAAVAVFYPVCFHEFVRWDDPHNFINNPRVYSPSLQDAAWFWHNAYAHLYVPLTYTVWSAVGAVARTAGGPSQPAELNAYVFHALNLAIHLASVALVCRILMSLGTGAWPACAGASLFAVHPVQVETVAWASGTKDLLAGMFGLWSVFMITQPPAPRVVSRRFALATALYILAMLSKPSAVVVPAAAMTLAVLPRAGTMAQRLRGLIGPMALWLVLAVPVIIIARTVQPAESLRFVPPLWARPIVAADALAFYLAKIIAPAHLAIDYGRSPQWLLSSGAAWFTVPAVIAAGAAAVVLRRRWPELGVGLIVLTVCVAPVLGLVGFDFQGYSTVADHYLYMAMLGPAAALAGLMRRFRGRLALAACGLVLAALAVRARFQVDVWRDSRTLFEHALKVNPDSRAAGVNMATELAGEAHALAAAGDAAGAMAVYDRAIARDRRVLHLFPWDPHARRALAEMHTARGAIAATLLGDLKRAVKEFEEALRYEPEYLPAQENLAKARRLLDRPGL